MTSFRVGEARCFILGCVLAAVRTFPGDWSSTCRSFSSKERLNLKFNMEAHSTLKCSWTISLIQQIFTQPGSGPGSRPEARPSRQTVQSCHHGTWPFCRSPPARPTPVFLPGLASSLNAHCGPGSVLRSVPLLPGPELFLHNLPTTSYHWHFGMGSRSPLWNFP